MTPHTIHVGALENYTKSKNITKVVNRTLIGNRGMERTNVTIIFANIRTSKSTYYLLYDTSHSKTHTTIITFHFQFCYKFRLHQLKKRKN